VAFFCLKPLKSSVFNKKAQQIKTNKNKGIQAKRVPIEGTFFWLIFGPKISPAKWNQEAGQIHP